MLGDVNNSDAAYTGEDGSSMLGMQYYRDKVAQFQGELNRLDAMYQVITDTIGATGDTDLDFALSAWVNDFNSKKTEIRLAAEGINMAAAAINAAGGRMGELSIPQTLQGLGLAPLAIAGAVAAAAALTYWIGTMIQAGADIFKQRDLIAAAGGDPDKLAMLTQAAAKADAIRNNTGALSQISGTIKWIAIAAMAFFALQAYSQHSRR